jgi:hypothetical protein
MTIGTPHALFIGSEDLALSPNHAITLTSGAAVGERVWVFRAGDCADVSPQEPTLNATDTKGNTWTTFQPLVRNGVTLGTAFVDGFTTVLTTALVSGDVITVNCPAGDWASNKISTAVIGCTGVDTLDKQAIYTGAATSSLSIGPTAATDTADEIIFAWWGSGIRVFTEGTNYTELAETASSARQLSLEYRIVSATGAQTATGTFATSSTQAGAMSTWRATTAGGDPGTGVYILNSSAEWDNAEAILL